MLLMLPDWSALPGIVLDRLFCAEPEFALLLTCKAWTGTIVGAQAKPLVLTVKRDGRAALVQAAKAWTRGRRAKRAAAAAA